MGSGVGARCPSESIVRDRGAQLRRVPAPRDGGLDRDVALVDPFPIDAGTDNLSEADGAEYRRAFLDSGEDRRPTLKWPPTAKA